MLIGTAEFRTLPLIPAAANSLDGMYRTLVDADLGGWNGEQVTKVLNPDNAADLIVRIRRLAESTTGTLLLYYVGHGLITPRGELALTVVNTDDTDPDVTGVEYSRIRDALVGSPARVKAVILDCCWSGRAIEALAVPELVADSTDIQGAYTLTASDRAAHVPPLAQQAEAPTSFTGDLLDLVATGLPGGPRWLTLDALYPHLRQRLLGRGLPAPNQRGTDTASRFPFTRNTAYHDEPQLLNQLPQPAAEKPVGRIGRRTLISGIAGATAVLAAVTAREIMFRAGPQPQVSTQPRSFRPPAPLGQPLTGHKNPVVPIAFSFDSTVLATSAGGDKWVHLWDVRTRKQIDRLPVAMPKGTIEADPLPMAFSPGEMALAFADTTIRMWDVKFHEQRSYLAPRSPASTSALAFSPDAGILATAGFDNAIRLWELYTDKGARQVGLIDNQETGLWMEFSPDGKILAVSSRDKIRFWQVGTRTQLGQLTDVNGSSMSAAFSPDGKILATADADATRLWDAQTREQLGRLPHSQTDAEPTVAFSPNGKILATGGFDRAVQLWEVSTRKEITKPLYQYPGVASVAISPDGKTLAAGNLDGTIQLWRL